MQVIISGRRVLPTNGIGRAFVRFQDNIYTYQRVQMVNPRRLCTTRVRVLRDFRVKRPTVFLFRIMISGFHTRCLTREDVDKVSQIQCRCLFSQVSRDRYSVRSSFLQTSWELCFHIQIRISSVPTLVPYYRAFTGFKSACVQLMAISIQIINVVTRYFSYLFQE